MRGQTELKKLGCQIFTQGGTGLKVVIGDGNITLLHLTPTGMAVGSAKLDLKNAQRLGHEIAEALVNAERASKS
jgi:hypothetical protein